MDPSLFPSTEYPGEVEDSTSGKDAPDLELISYPVTLHDHGFSSIPMGDLVSIGVVLLR